MYEGASEVIISVPKTGVISDECFSDFKMFTHCVSENLKKFTHCASDNLKKFTHCVSENFKMFTHCVLD